MNIIEQLHQVLPQMSEKLQAVASVLLNDSYRSSLMSVRQLAKEAGVSSATVLGLVQILGFKHYKDMCHAFHESALIDVPAHAKAERGKYFLQLQGFPFPATGDFL
ncbi:MurR/RpiR family transcriptional regulator [Aminivibrio sp.]|uniref:MurR/RpiR family transcriptional regulator n=1 Tax=Aminivibrio sp. TaxID=1872489 RepID=UPI003D97C761